MNVLLGKKLGMTRVYDAAGRQVPVTVLAVGPCVVLQRRTRETDGYDAAQLGFGARKAARTNQPAAGHAKKAGVAAPQWVREVPLAADEAVKAGDVLTAAMFEGVEFVDVIGVTKGRGFQGVMKRHNMSGQPMAHGHTMHRRPGSIGMREHPGRILKNKRLPGHMGDTRVTTQNLRLVQVRTNDHVLLVRGSVPGAAGGYVMVRKALKKAEKAS